MVDGPSWLLLVRIVQGNAHGVVQPNEWSDPHRAELLVLVRLGPAHGLSISLLDLPAARASSQLSSLGLAADMGTGGGVNLPVYPSHCFSLTASFSWR